MQVTSIKLTQFRCFKSVQFELAGKNILIGGLNGSGKTSLIEALHYVCYLRSFRTYFSKDLIASGHDNFFITIDILTDQGDVHVIQVGASAKKRLVKVDKKAVGSYKELIDYYRVITITEDDLMLIRGGPENRRLFLDQAVSLFDHSYLSILKTYKTILSNRNMLLEQSSFHNESYEIWTKKMWEQSLLIEDARKKYIVALQEGVNNLVLTYFQNSFSFSCSYKTKAKYASCYENFLQENAYMLQQEKIYKRSLFGAHLDDMQLRLFDKDSKTFASRGQQKLFVVLLKIAQSRIIRTQKGAAIFLVDDFMTDFDQKTSFTLIGLLTDLSSQCIFTSPVQHDAFQQEIERRGGLLIELSH